MERTPMKTTFLDRFVLCSLAGLATVMASAAVAQDALPRSGEVALRYTFTNTTTSEFGPVPRGPKAADGISAAGGWMSWLMRADGSSGFGHKLTGKCAMAYRQNPQGFDLVVGNCAYADADGDLLFESFDGLNGKWTGGTGKYEGISGAFEFTDIVMSANAGYEMLAGVKVGSYGLP